MPHLPAQYGSFPLTLRDYTISNPKRGELLLDYDTNELYFCQKSSGKIISVAREIYDKILASKIQNNDIIVYDSDKLPTQPSKYDTVPPLKDRKYNTFYYIVTRRKNYADDPANNPLTAPKWAVRSGKTFLGKNSGYNPHAVNE